MMHIKHKITNIRAITLSFTIAFVLIGLFTTAINIVLVNAITWSSDNQLTTDLAYDATPSVMETQNGTIWVVWASDRILMQYDLFCMTSADNGLSWTNPNRLTLNQSSDQSPSVMQVQNGTIWIVWASKRTGNFEIFYMTSPNHGQTWTDPFQLTDSSYKDTNPSVSQNVDGTICVVWQRKVEGNYDLFCMTSSNHGASWTGPTQLTTHPDTDISASITYTWNGTLWVVWSSHRTGIYDLFCMTSADNGLSWIDPSPFVTSNKYDSTPSICMNARNESIWVVWAQQQGTQYDLYYKASLDHGLSWTPETELPLDDSGDDSSPSVMVTYEGKIWVVWESERTLNYDIFYKISDTIAIHDVAITSVTPSTTIVYKPDVVSIQVVTENQGTRNETFEVNCYVNSTSIGPQIITLANGTATTLIFSWDTSIFPCGNYTISANTSILPDETAQCIDDNSFTDGTVEVDIPDLNGDGIVDILDLYIVMIAFGTVPGMPGWDARADIAEPIGLIDGRDMTVIAEHFGQTK